MFVPRGLCNGIGARVKRSFRVVSRACSAQCSDKWQFRFVLISFRAGTDRGHDNHDCKFRVPEMPEACKTERLVAKALLRSLVVGGRDVVYSIPKVGLLE